MHMPFTRTIESPCRKCRNIHLNKEQCSEKCLDLQAFQEAIVHMGERNISEFGSSREGKTDSQ